MLWGVAGKSHPLHNLSQMETLKAICTMILLDIAPERATIQRLKVKAYWILGVTAWLILSILIFGERS